MVYLGLTSNIVCLVIVDQDFVYSTVNLVVVDNNSKEPRQLFSRDDQIISLSSYNLVFTTFY